MKTCKDCKIEKLKEEFYKHKLSKDGLEYICISCSKIKSKNRNKKYPKYLTEWQKINKERVANYQRKYVSQDKYKYRIVWLNQYAISKKQYDRLDIKDHSIFGEKCLRCFSNEDLTIDHVVPLSKGGKNIKENLQTLCRSCNSFKQDKIMDFRDIRTIYFNKEKYL